MALEIVKYEGNDGVIAKVTLSTLEFLNIFGVGEDFSTFVRGVLFFTF
jgi:hypothetical protein